MAHPVRDRKGAFKHIAVGVLEGSDAVQVVTICGTNENLCIYEGPDLRGVEFLERIGVSLSKA